MIPFLVSTLYFCCYMKKLAALFLVLIFPYIVFGQKDSISKHEVYHVIPKYELTGSIALLTASYFGFRELDRISDFTADDIAKLDISKINAFDRPVASYDPAKYYNAQVRSDFFLNFSIASPILLALDRRARKDWLDLITLYLVTHTVDNAIYFGAAFPIRRARPFTYNNAVPMDERIGDAKSNSFFSGHVSFAATSTFFLVKVYTDIHQIKGWKRLALFTAAAVPPGLVGYYRVQGARHFRTDALLGMVIGAGTGILIPELHRKIKNNKRLSLQPYFSPIGANGFALQYTF
jgi:membrane-associated phospholipid phosphatase